MGRATPDLFKKCVALFALPLAHWKRGSKIIKYQNKNISLLIYLTADNLLLNENCAATAMLS